MCADILKEGKALLVPTEQDYVEDAGACPAAFVTWFTENYPSGCTITDPAWHAVKVYRAARRAHA